MTEFPPILHIERTNNQPKGYFMFSKSTGPFSSISIGEPKNWASYQEEEKRYLQAEEKRLIYVAATRAKNLLIISNSEMINKNPWNLLIKNLKEDNEIQVPDIQHTLMIEDDRQTINIDDFNRIKSECENWQNELSCKGYLTASPTDYKDASKFWSISREDGSGISWGNAVHKTLEHLVKGNEDLEMIVESALIENGFPLDKKNELISLIERFKQSAIWTRIQKAEANFTEVPFSVKVDNQHSIVNLIKLEGDIPIILTGTIDLVFKEDGEWVVVDYKTDHASTKEDYNRLEEIYKTQTKIYSFVLEELLGEKVKSEEIVFLELL